MSKIAISGASTGTATFTIESPATSTNRTITLADATGTMVVSGTTPSLNGITFPATQVASAGANTLDDYEEGTWTPTDASGAALSFTNTSGNCFYTKIGQIVIASFRVTYPSTADGANAKIGGFPFAAGSGTNNTQAVSFSQQNYLAGAMGTMNSTATDFSIITTSGGSVTVRTNADISGKDFRGTAVYFV
jgi:hypothetical protein